MSLANKKIGFAFTGSFCTFENAFIEMEHVIKEGALVTAIFSFSSQTIDSRFGKAKDFLEKAEKMTGREVITTIATAEPVGPQKLFDIIVIAPCTGNTIGKLANGITDTPVLMAAKAHIRNNKPLLLSLATNDALGINLRNIGTLISTKNIYFVPFGQDNSDAKPNSMVSHTQLIVPALEKALNGEQLQPVVKSPH